MSKYCINCKFYVEYVDGPSYDKHIYNVCSKSLDKAETDLVTGVKRRLYTQLDRCQNHRQQTDNKLDFCGADALWFEAKSS